MPSQWSSQQKIDRYRHQIGALASLARKTYIEDGRLEPDDPISFVVYVAADGRGTVDSAKGDAREHLASFTTIPAGMVGLSTPSRDELILWGSDCTSCGNTTPESMFCDECGSDAHTVPLYSGKREGVSPQQPKEGITQ